MSSAPETEHEKIDILVRFAGGLMQQPGMLLTTEDELLFIVTRVVVAALCRKEIIRLLHEGHYDITKAREGASDCFPWPTVGLDIAVKAKPCHEYVKSLWNRKMPLRSILSQQTLDFDLHRGSVSI